MIRIRIPASSDTSGVKPSWMFMGSLFVFAEVYAESARRTVRCRTFGARGANMYASAQSRRTRSAENGRSTRGAPHDIGKSHGNPGENSCQARAARAAVCARGARAAYRRAHHEAVSRQAPRHLRGEAERGDREASLPARALRALAAAAPRQGP